MRKLLGSLVMIAGAVIAALGTMLVLRRDQIKTNGHPLGDDPATVLTLLAIGIALIVGGAAIRRRARQLEREGSATREPLG
jgi:uncharacterized membrane protein YidH (DUF202 family)